MWNMHIVDKITCNAAQTHIGGSIYPTSSMPGYDLHPRKSKTQSCLLFPFTIGSQIFFKDVGVYKA